MNINVTDGPMPDNSNKTNNRDAVKGSDAAPIKETPKGRPEEQRRVGKMIKKRKGKLDDFEEIDNFDGFDDLTTPNKGTDTKMVLNNLKRKMSSGNRSSQNTQDGAAPIHDNNLSTVGSGELFEDEMPSGNSSRGVLRQEERNYQVRGDDELTESIREIRKEYGMEEDMVMEPSTPAENEDPQEDQSNEVQMLSVKVKIEEEGEEEIDQRSADASQHAGSIAGDGENMSRASGKSRSVISIDSPPETRDGLSSDDDEVLAQGANKVSALNKFAKKHTGKAKDDSKAKAALLNGVKARVDEVLRSVPRVESVKINRMIIDDDYDINTKAVDHFLTLLSSKRMKHGTHTFIGWHCSSRGKVVVEDGRHRLLAIKQYIANCQEKRRAAKEDPIDESMIEMCVEVSKGQLEARIRRMSMMNAVTTTVFQNAIRIRCLMRELDMLDNVALTTEMCTKIINHCIHSGGKQPGDKGVPIYTVQAALMDDNEFKIITANARFLIAVKKTLTLYFAAKSVNPDRAFNILCNLDELTDKNSINDEYEKLAQMNHSVKDLLEYKCYEEEDALSIQERIYKCRTSYSTVKRLITARNRLHHLPEVLDEFMIPLEKCLPPVTFVKPQLIPLRKMEDAASTLLIFDTETFCDGNTINEVAALIDSAHDRSLTFIVVGALEQRLRNELNKALGEFRRMKRQRCKEPSISVTFDVAVAQLTVDCAKFKAANGLLTVNVGACLFRSTHGQVLEKNALTSFLKLMKIGGRINRTCLRLLSFDPIMEVSNNRWNTLFVSCSTAAPIAVAALSANYRVSVLRSIDSQLKTELMKMQSEMDDKWMDFPSYKDNYTVDGKIRNPATPKQKRNRTNKMRNGVASGLVPNDE